MNEKLCVFCKHFDFEAAGYRSYSTLTGGDTTGGLSCMAGHYVEVQPHNTEDFRRVIQRAGTCPNYEPPT